MSRVERWREWCRRVKSLCDQGLLQEALGCVKSRAHDIPEHVLSDFLQECINRRDLCSGREVYDLLARADVPIHAYIGSYLIRMFDACGSLIEANEVFDKIWTHNCYTWSAIILAQANHGNASTALDLFCKMHHSGRRPDEHTFVAVLKACIILLELALVIGAYTKSGFALQACSMFEQMQQESVQPDTFTLVSILEACAIMQVFYRAKFFHSIVHVCGFMYNMHVGTALIDAYLKCGHVIDAHNVFDDVQIKSLVTWNAMISGFVQQACYNEALFLYHQLQEDTKMLPDVTTYVNILKASSSMVDLNFGQLLHDCIVKRGFDEHVFVGNTLIDMYGKCGQLEEAYRLFAKQPFRDVVTWNTIISAYIQQGHIQEAFQMLRLMKQASIDPDIASWNAIIAGYANYQQGEEALETFKLMQCDMMKPDSLTFSSLFKACSSITALDLGKIFHFYVIESGLMDIIIESALVDLYAKSGSYQDAFKMFQSFSEGDLVKCNAMLAGYALHDEHDLAWHLYEDMQRHGLKPDKITVSGLLSLCSHLGLVKDACQYIQMMASDCGGAPTRVQYGCILDILGRIGHLNEAKELLQTIPSRDNILHWVSLLTNCRVYGEIGLGNLCFHQVEASDKAFGSTYVMLASLYGEAF